MLLYLNINSPTFKKVAIICHHISTISHKYGFAQWFRFWQASFNVSLLLHQGEGPKSRDENRDPQCHLPAGKDRQPVWPADHLPERQQHKEHLRLPRRRKGRFSWLLHSAFVQEKSNGMMNAAPQRGGTVVASDTAQLAPTLGSTTRLEYCACCLFS